MKKGNNKVNNLFSSKLTFILIFVTFISVVGSTYAYLYFSEGNNEALDGNMATVNLSLTVTRVFPVKASTGVMVPQKSISASSTSPLSSALKRGCVDDNANIVCQVYSITIQNSGGTATEIVDGFISFYSDQELTVDSSISMPNLSWKLITSVDTTNNNNSVLGTNIDNRGSSTNASFVRDVRLETNDNETYYMIIWFNETDADQIDKNNTFYGKVTFDSSNGTGITASF